jgi:hypothetical protein
MYNKKYILTKIEQFNRPNPIYLDMQGCVCFPVYFNVGERGWFLYDADDCSDYLHRVHTSVVKSVDYIYDMIIVETKNTRYEFTEA